MSTWVSWGTEAARAGQRWGRWTALQNGIWQVFCQGCVCRVGSAALLAAVGLPRLPVSPRCPRAQPWVTPVEIGGIARWAACGLGWGCMADEGLRERRGDTSRSPQAVPMPCAGRPLQQHRYCQGTERVAHAFCHLPGLSAAPLSSSQRMTLQSHPSQRRPWMLTLLP